MKANHILFSSLAVILVSAYSFSPSDLLKHKSTKGRNPASAEESKPEEKNDEVKKENVQCKAESKGEKLKADLQSLLNDKEAILKEIEVLKEEKEKLGKKKPLPKQDNDSETIALMSQITSLLSMQMQSQMQMQMQMMSFFTQMQFYQAPEYTMDFSQFYNQYGIRENSNPFGRNFKIGIPAAGENSYLSPYSELPLMNRQPAHQEEFGYFLDRIPQANNLRGFDFNMSPSEPLLPQMKRQEFMNQSDTPSVSNDKNVPHWDI